MMYTIRVSDGVDKVIAKWKKSNPNLFKKYKKIYKELLEHPKTGLGHPEALRGGGDITWSRHITAHDRIIYDIYEEVVEVGKSSVSCPLKPSDSTPLKHSTMPP